MEKNWDLHLQPTAFIIRSNINNSTKYTPAELVLGGNVMRPIDLPVTNDKPHSFRGRQAREFAENRLFCQDW